MSDNHAETIHIMEYAARNGIEEIGAADDLPLFSGQPVAVRVRPFRPQPAVNQAAFFDMRPDPFNTRQACPELVEGACPEPVERACPDHRQWETPDHGPHQDDLPTDPD